MELYVEPTPRSDRLRVCGRQADDQQLMSVVGLGLIQDQANYTQGWKLRLQLFPGDLGIPTSYLNGRIDQ